MNEFVYFLSTCDFNNFDLILWRFFQTAKLCDSCLHDLSIQGPLTDGVSPLLALFFQLLDGDLLIPQLFS